MPVAVQWVALGRQWWGRYVALGQVRATRAKIPEERVWETVPKAVDSAWAAVVEMVLRSGAEVVSGKGQLVSAGKQSLKSFLASLVVPVEWEMARLHVSSSHASLQKMN